MELWRRMSDCTTLEQREDARLEREADNRAHPRGPMYDSTSGEIVEGPEGSIIEGVQTWTREYDRPKGDLKGIISECDAASR